LLDICGELQLDSRAAFEDIPLEEAVALPKNSVNFDVLCGLNNIRGSQDNIISRAYLHENFTSRPARWVTLKIRAHYSRRAIEDRVEERDAWEVWRR
jgi:hypothetical protein